MYNKKAQNFIKIKKQVKRVLSKSRYQHTLGVTYTAAALAMRYECDINRAMTAGLLHDCAKYMSEEELMRYCLRYHITINDTEKINPGLLHAKVGSFLAIKKYHIHDKEITAAIMNHTTGCPDMTLLDKIIFVADYIEPNRDNVREPLPNITEIRKLAFTDIDKALLVILESTLSYLKSIDVAIDSMTQKTHDYYAKLLQDKKGQETE